MQKTGKKNQIFGNFLKKEKKKKNAKTGKEFSIEAQKERKSHPTSEMKNPLDFCSISDRSVPEMGKKSSGFFISDDGKRHLKASFLQVLLPQKLKCKYLPNVDASLESQIFCIPLQNS